MSLVVPKLWCPLILRVLRPRWNDLQLTTKVDPLLNSLTCFWKQVQLFNAHWDFLPLAYHSTLMPHCVMGRDAIILLQKKKKRRRKWKKKKVKKGKEKKKEENQFLISFTLDMIAFASAMMWCMHHALIGETVQLRVSETWTLYIALFKSKIYFFW